MATLQYTVFANAGATGQGPVVNEGTIEIAGSSAPSSTVMDPAASPANQMRSVRVKVNADAYVTWGETPAAVNDGSEGRDMDSGTWEYFQIPANHKIAAIQKV